MRSAQAGQLPRRTAARLALVVSACIVPATLIALLLIGYDYYDRERERLTRDSMTTARALIAAVDAELDGVRSALLALATSPHLSSANFAAFHGQAESALQGQAFVNVILSDRSGRQLINTFRPFGEPLPAQGDPGGLLRVFETGTPVISGLFQGRVTRSYIVGVGVPVRRDGEVRYALTAGLSPDRLSQMLTQQKLPQGWIAGILDGSGTIVARTVEAERLIGQKGSPELVRRMREVQEDAFESRTLEGIPVLTVMSRSSVSGWAVAIGIPQRELTAHLWYSMARLFIAAFIALITALGLAALLGRRLMR